MKEQYKIYMLNQPVGTAIVKAEGLYYSFACSCSIQTDGIYKITVCEGEHSQKLGVLVPNGLEYILTTRLPKKRFLTDAFSFQVTGVQSQASGTYIPLALDKPYSYISKLRNSFLEIHDEQKGVRLPDELC